MLDSTLRHLRIERRSAGKYFSLNMLLQSIGIQEYYILHLTNMNTYVTLPSVYIIYIEYSVELYRECYIYNIE